MFGFGDEGGEIKCFFNFDIVIEFDFPPPSVGESFDLKDKNLG